MIEFMSNWVENVIVGVIIITIIEQLLPNNSNGKYVKLMGGIVILMLIISPYIQKFVNKNNNVINIEKYISGIENETVETSAKIDNSEIIKKMYEENLIVDIKTKITEKGYVCGNVGVKILNNNEYTIEKIDVNILEKKATNKKSRGTVVTFVQNIENVKINLQNKNNDNKSVISASEIKKLKEYLSENYKVDENNICIK